MYLVSYHYHRGTYYCSASAPLAVIQAAAVYSEYKVQQRGIFFPPSNYIPL